MGNVADKLFVLLLLLQLFFRRFLKPQAHVLIVTIQITYFTGRIRGKPVIKIAFLYLLHGYVQLVYRCKHSLVNPLRQHQAGKQQNQADGNKHIY